MTLSIIVVCFGFKNKPTVIHFRSIRKSNEEIKEEIVFDNEEFWGINVMKWRKFKNKNVEALSDKNSLRRKKLRHSNS